MPTKTPDPTEAPARKPGRPKGTGTGAQTRRYNITLPLDVADWLDEKGSPSATIADALRREMSRKSRR